MKEAIVNELLLLFLCKRKNLLDDIMLIDVPKNITPIGIRLLERGRMRDVRRSVRYNQ